MTGPFGEDELFEDEWVEICDIEGRKAALRHLATIKLGDKTYMILGAHPEDMDEKGALMLVREDQTVDGAREYVVARDEQEVERVVSRFVMHLLMEQMEQEADVLPEMDEMTAMDSCGCEHLPGEFCYCDDPEYLQ